MSHIVSWCQPLILLITNWSTSHELPGAASDKLQWHFPLWKLNMLQCPVVHNRCGGCRCGWRRLTLSLDCQALSGVIVGVHWQRTLETMVRWSISIFVITTFENLWLMVPSLLRGLCPWRISLTYLPNCFPVITTTSSCSHSTSPRVSPFMGECWSISVRIIPSPYNLFWTHTYHSMMFVISRVFQIEKLLYRLTHQENGKSLKLPEIALNASFQVFKPLI